MGKSVIYIFYTNLITLFFKDPWHTNCFLQELTISYSPQCLFATYWQLIWKIKMLNFERLLRPDRVRCRVNGTN